MSFVSKTNSGLTRWIPAKGSLDLREGITIENLKNEPVKIRVKKTKEPEESQEINLEGTEYERKPEQP